MYLDIHVWAEVDVDERVQHSVDLHQFVPAAGPEVVLSVQEEPDESSLGVLPLRLGDHVPAVQDLHVGQPGHQHRPLLLPVEVVKERTALYTEVIEPRELPQLLHLRPAADLGGGNVQT